MVVLYKYAFLIHFIGQMNNPSDADYKCNSKLTEFMSLAK